jgi:hypothetical protein
VRPPTKDNVDKLASMEPLSMEVDINFFHDLYICTYIGMMVDYHQCST